jgi:hypothetical protein
MSAVRDELSGVRLADRQRAFAAALLDASQPIPAGVVDPTGKPCPRRFGVYRNNVLSGLIEALQESFPAVRRLVGEECFRAMARLYAILSPPRSAVMLQYGADFPAFIAGFEPTAALPYLPEVARIERAWLEAYHAMEAVQLDPATLATVAPTRR